MVDPRQLGRMEAGDQSPRLAVLIDADNAQASMIKGLLAEVARIGEATVKRIYGDFTSSQTAQWKKVLNQHSIKPVQQFAYTTGKNATDSTLIIDAMDLLYTRRFDGFCLVSSDSDFTGLAVRIREEGLFVLGVGEQKTPEAFRNACHKFVFTDVLHEVATETPAPEAGGRKKAAKASSASPDAAPAPSKETNRRTLPKKFMLQALDEAVDDSGWAHLGAFGSYLNKLQPDFDPRLYGHKKLSSLVKAHNKIFEVDERPAPGGNGKDLYIRAR